MTSMCCYSSVAHVAALYIVLQIMFKLRGVPLIGSDLGLSSYFLNCKFILINLGLSFFEFSVSVVPAQELYR